MVAAAKAEDVIKLLKKEYPSAKYYLNFSNPLELMIAAILSAQCRDEVVNAVTSQLFKKYKTVEGYTKLEQEDIKSITFFKNKAKNVREACKVIIQKYNGKVPDRIDELVTLPGIGRKTANVILINVFNKISGIPVDTHVIRVAYRLGLTKNTSPEKIEKDLMAVVPKSEWKRLTWLFKDHGRAVCKAPAPICGRCVLNRICPKNGVTKQI